MGVVIGFRYSRPARIIEGESRWGRGADAVRAEVKDFEE